MSKCFQAYGSDLREVRDGAYGVGALVRIGTGDDHAAVGLQFVLGVAAGAELFDAEDAPFGRVLEGG